MRIAMIAGLGCLLVTSAALGVYLVVPSGAPPEEAPKVEAATPPAAPVAPGAPTTASATPPSAPIAPAAPPSTRSAGVNTPMFPAAPIVAAPAPPPPAAAPAKAAAPAVATATPAPAAAPALAPVRQPTPKCDNPNAYGVARTVEIDTTGGPGFGFEHFQQHDFLRNNEVVLTFDDGPWERSTPIVLKALADQCVRATFFTIGKHATYYPGVIKQVYEAGHSVGTHSWSHPRDIGKMSVEDGKTEIEKGISAVVMSTGAPVAPFFRFPSLIHPPELVKYLGSRNIGIFSTDMDSFDFKNRKPETVIKAVLDKLKKRGKGIVLMHDFHLHTAQATADLLTQLKANGYKIVHMRARDVLRSLPEYDDLVRKEQKNPIVSDRPTSSVVRTID